MCILFFVYYNCCVFVFGGGNAKRIIFSKFGYEFLGNAVPPGTSLTRLLVETNEISLFTRHFNDSRSEADMRAYLIPRSAIAVFRVEAA